MIIVKYVLYCSDDSVGSNGLRNALGFSRGNNIATDVIREKTLPAAVLFFSTPP